MHRTNRPSPSWIPVPARIDSRRPRPFGFTLVELMVVLAIAAVLVALALPSYRESIARGARAEATGDLVAARQWMERFYAEHQRYDRTRAGTVTTDAALFPARFSQSPRAGDGPARYRIALQGLQPHAYTVVATRLAGGPTANDPCGDFTLDHTGRQGLLNWSTARFGSGTDGLTAAIAACWRS